MPTHPAVIEFVNDAGTPIRVLRSAKRQKTISAVWKESTMVVSVPAALTQEAERILVLDMVKKLERKVAPGILPDLDAVLMDRARAMDKALFGGSASPASVRWVGNQNRRWGSASLRSRRSGSRTGCGACRNTFRTMCWPTSSRTWWSRATATARVSRPRYRATRACMMRTFSCPGSATAMQAGLRCLRGECRIRLGLPLGDDEDLTMSSRKQTNFTESSCPEYGRAESSRAETGSLLKSGRAISITPWNPQNCKPKTKAG